MGRATRADVARQAGVSTATVSYVLNNSRSISEDTRIKVLQAVAELNYKPDMIARSMVTSRTMQLGIVLENIANPFYSDIIIGFENAAIEKGYFVNICTGYKNLDDYFDNFVSRRLDGIFIVAIPYKFHMEKVYRLVDEGIKVVMSANVEADIKKVSSIESDYIEAMDQAVGYLNSLGHNEIAYLSGLGRNLKFDKKVAGYLAAVEKYKLPAGDSLLFDGSAPYTTDIADGYNLACKLIDSGKKFTAAICLNDLMAMGAIKAFKEKGYRVPEDVSVLGFDDIPYAAAWTPSITTMAVQKSLFGAKAFELLQTNISKGNTGFFMNKLQLIKRASTAQI